MSLPTKFAVSYVFQNGSLPPPYHYELAIRIDPGRREALYHFRPGYPGQGEGTQLWRASFPLGLPEREALYKKLVALEFERPWRAGPSPGVTSPIRLLTITGGRKLIRVPAFPASRKDQARLIALCKAVESVVPRSLKEEFERRYDRLKLNRDPAGIR